MAISKAVSLANLSSGDSLTIDSVNDRVGIGSTVPTTTLDVDGSITSGNINSSGIITATAFVGDGTNITNAGSTLNASSGDQRLVVTSQTTGSMTEVGTTGDLTYNSTTKTLSAENISIGGTLTYDDVTNVDSVGIVTAGGGIRIGTGGTIGPVGSGIVTYYGDGSKLTGIDASSLKDSNGTIKVQANTSGIVVSGIITGDGSGITFAPKILAFDPAAISNGVAVNKTITITFDQNISFSGNGTVELRSGSVGGSVIQSFAITGGSPATGLSIVGTQLIINPTSNLPNNTVVYVILPSTGIVNSAGSAYGGSNTYNFQTIQQTFTIEGGNSVWTTTNPSSPTGYYRYHVFDDASTVGVATFSADTTQAIDLYAMLVAGGGAGGSTGDSPVSPRQTGGGGGGGGVLTYTGPTLNLPAGTYNFHVGAGGTGLESPQFSPDSSFLAAVPQMSGRPSKIESPNVTVQAVGGGGGGQGGGPSDYTLSLSGGSGGGGLGLWDPSPSPGPLTRPASPGISGQGFPGGDGKNFTAATGTQSYDIGVSGGGGGAGGAGGAGTNLPGAGYPSGSAGAHVGGYGGSGKPVTQFSSNILTGNTNIPGSDLTRIGSTGLYGGGGGGIGGPGPGQGAAGKGGPGGGGDGTPFNMVTAYPAAGYDSPGNGSQGVNFCGGGGGGTSSGSNQGNGGHGVIIIRYAISI